MKIVVVGSGSWGTALGQVLVDNGQDVRIYGIDIDEIIDIDKYHQNSKYFDKLDLNPNLRATNDIDVISEADVIILSLPSYVLDDFCLQIKDMVKKPVILVNTAKGFHPTTFNRLSTSIREHFPNKDEVSLVSLIGPSHAEEVVERFLTVVSAVSDDIQASTTVQKLFSNNYFRVYTSDDVIGSEIGVALKNVMAIASGIMAGLELTGDNAKAALMTRGLAEIVRYGIANGGKSETFLGLTGIGDLIVTCTSKHSRNFQAGFMIGKHDSAEYFWENNNKTVEGVNACKIVYQEAKRLNVEMPIVNQVYKVLFEKGIPSQSIDELMGRDLKKESVDN